jgi:hypothetical protein
VVRGPNVLAVTWRMGFRLDKPDICQEMKDKLKSIRYGDLAKAGFILQRVVEARPIYDNDRVLNIAVLLDLSGNSHW